MMDRQQAMTEAEGYIERMNLKALSEKDNDQLGTIVKEAYMSGMNTSQRAIFDHSCTQHLQYLQHCLLHEDLL